MTSRESDLLAQIPNQLFIGGRWVDAEGQKTLDVFDPSTGEVIRRIADASRDDWIFLLALTATTMMTNRMTAAQT